jgi:hypothetical protein
MAQICDLAHSHLANVGFIASSCLDTSPEPQLTAGVKEHVKHICLSERRCFMRHIWISASVGRQGVNSRGDVLSVQQLINDHLPAPLHLLSADGICGPHTIAAIEQVERSLFSAYLSS